MKRLGSTADESGESTEEGVDFDPPTSGNATAEAVYETAFEWARSNDFAGYDPYDGLNSPFLAPLRRHWLTRLVGMHAVRLAPVNLRPYLRVPKQRHPKGIGLFAQSCLNRYEQTGEYLDEAETLLEWLDDNSSEAFSQPCWGANFDWQNARKFFLPAHHPCAVMTVYCARAFLRHYELTGSERSLEVAVGAAEFIRNENNTVRVGDVDAISYTPYDTFVVVNANALAANYLRSVGQTTGDSALLERAEELFEFVVDAQAENGAWYYSVPASESHLNHDNFHTGFILESLYDYAMSKPPGDPARIAYERGMEFYRNELFEPDGAPRFEHDTPYPYDIHASAQAIITFSQPDPPDTTMARKVLEWTLSELFDEEGYFYRRTGRLLTDTTPYMRWSQAWMCLALSEYLLAIES